jgi:D-amino-acid dehydrogenase
MKGYSITVPLRDVDVVPDVSLTDQCEKLVFSHLGEVLRVAGTAEFAGYDHKVNPKRIAGLKRLTEKLYPGCGDLEHIKKWACVRPSTPDGCPTLGNTRFHNLVLNTGHGSLGWTLGPGSGRIAADIVEDKQPEIDITGLTMERF